MNSIKFLLLAAWLCLGLDAFAQTTYFIAPPPTGNNNNNGSENAPWASLSFALAQNQVINGDIIQVQTGSYTEAQTISVNKSVTITGLGGEVSLSSSSTPLLNITASVVTIQGLTLSPPAEPVDNSIGISIASPPGEEADITIRQNTISGFASGIAVNQVSNLTITNNIINANANGITINAPAFDNIIVNENNLSGNTVNALENNAVGLIDASLNWWGSATASNITLEITNIDQVNYSPWLNVEEDINDELAGFQPSFVSLGVRRITSNLDALTDAYNLVEVEGNIIVYPSLLNNNPTYEAIIVDKNITLSSETLSNNPIPIESITTNGGDLTIDGLILTSQLTLTVGNVTIEGGYLTLSEGGSINENGTGQFIGEIQTEPFTLSAGTSISLLGVGISPGEEDLTDLSITRITGEKAIAEVGNSRSIEVLWDINVSNPDEFSPRTLTFSWQSVYDGEMDFTVYNAVVWKRPAPGNPWEFVLDTDITPNDENENLRSVTVNNVTSFSQWIVSDEVNPLPVELTRFSASLAEPHVELNWETASEINADYFSIERSENGKDFKEIGQLKAAGDSDTPLQYRYIDEQAAKRFSGSLFYRLRTVDFDESFEYSDITTVMISEDDIPMITAFACQGETSLKLFTRAIEPGDYHVWITDLSGRKIFEQDMQLVPKASYNLGVGNLPQSVYLIRCTGKQLALSTKFRIEEAD